MTSTGAQGTGRTRRRRPHPARRARRIAGAVTIASMLGLTGGMVAATQTTGSNVAAISVARTAATNASAVLATTSDDDTVTAAQRSAAFAAAPASASSQANTSTHAS